jgi:phage major head subunit gpT-like protein
MLISHESLQALQTAFKATFSEAFGKKVALYPKIATVVQSSTKSNTYSILGQMPKFRQWVGERIHKNVILRGYVIENPRYEVTVDVPADDIRDDQAGAYMPLMAGLGDAAKSHPDELVFAALKNGHAQECYDGQAFFDTDHPVVVNGAPTTTSNYDATGGGDMWILLDTTKVIKPIIVQEREPYSFQSFVNFNDSNVFEKNEFTYGSTGRTGVGFGMWQMAYASLNDLDKTTFEAARASMMALKSDEGRSLSVRPNICLVSTGKLAAAEALFNAQTNSDGSANVHYKECEIVHCPDLD